MGVGFSVFSASSNNINCFQRIFFFCEVTEMCLHVHPYPHLRFLIKPTTLPHHCILKLNCEVAVKRHDGQGNEFPLTVFGEIIPFRGLHNLQAWQGSKPFSHTECICPNRRFGALGKLIQAKGIEASSGSEEYSWGCIFVYTWTKNVLSFPPVKSVYNN